MLSNRFTAGDYVEVPYCTVWNGTPHCARDGGVWNSVWVGLIAGVEISGLEDVIDDANWFEKRDEGEEGEQA